MKHEKDLLMQCYNELLQETKDIPTVDEVWARYREKYGRETSVKPNKNPINKLKINSNNNARYK